MNTEIKAMLDSYLRNLLGVGLALVATTMTSAGLSSPAEFGTSELRRLLQPRKLLQLLRRL